MLNKIRKLLKNESGLTLVELLAVIVILGIISAIAVPSIGGVITNSKNDAKVAEALQIIDAARLAHAEDPEATSWTRNKNKNDLKDYVSKVNDENYTVKYNPISKKYSISKHDAAEVIDENNPNAEVTEDQLAAAAR